MRRRNFSAGAVWGLFILWIIFCAGIVYFGTSFAHAALSKEDDARLERAAAALIEAYNAVQEVRSQGGQVPPPPQADKQDWQCYLDRYDDVRRNGAYTAAWANRHYANWGQRENRIWGCTQVVEPTPPSGKKPWNHSNQNGSFGTSVNLCEQYSAARVDLDGTQWRYHRRDNNREVWHDPQMRPRLSGTVTVVLKNGEVIVAELEPGSGIRNSGDC